MQQHCLKIKSLRKKYKKRLVVNNVSFEIKTGQVVSLLGPNGAGKTTCFYMVVGLINSDNGEILLDNVNITNLSMAKRSHMGLGYLPQEPSIFRKLTVEENILSILQLSKTLNSDEQKQRMNFLLKEFNIEKIRENMGFSLSGGERRRVEIARAIALKPKFVLLDEPFAGVDPISITDINNVISYLSKQNIGILITDHNVRETLNISDYSYVLNQGTLLAYGAKEEILNNEDVKTIYLGKNYL